MKISRQTVKVIAACCIMAASAVWYLYGYRQNFILHNFYIWLILGWLFFLLPLEDKAATTGFDIHTRKLSLRTNKITWGFFILLFVICSLTNLVTVYLLSQKRSSDILNSGSTAITYGVVTGSNVRDSMQGNAIKALVIIRYEVYGQAIEQSFRDQNKTYRQGQNIRIKYAVNYPEMSRIVDE